jgi:hypothetical protein
VLKLQLLAWHAPALPDSQQQQVQALQVVGLGGGSSHSNLQAEFACAADDNNGMQELTNTAEQGKEVKAATRGRKAAVGTDAKSNCSRSSKAAAAAAEGTQPHEMDDSTWLAEVLLLLPACVQQPLLLKEACGMLSSRLQALGAVHAAAALLQLSLGEQTYKAVRAAATLCAAVKTVAAMKGCSCTSARCVCSFLCWHPRELQPLRACCCFQVPPLHSSSC